MASDERLQPNGSGVATGGTDRVIVSLPSDATSGDSSALPSVSSSPVLPSSALLTTDVSVVDAGDTIIDDSVAPPPSPIISVVTVDDDGDSIDESSLHCTDPSVSDGSSPGGSPVDASSLPSIIEPIVVDPTPDPSTGLPTTYTEFFDLTQMVPPAHHELYAGYDFQFTVDGVDGSPDANDNQDCDCISLDDDSILADYPPGLGLSDNDYLDLQIEHNDIRGVALHAAWSRVQSYPSANDFYVHMLSQFSDLSTCAHVDGGSQATTTCRRDLLWYVQPVVPTSAPTFYDAGDHGHRPTHRGYLKVPSSTTDGFSFVLCYYTPTLKATIISPDKVSDQFGCRGYTAVCLRDGGSSVTMVSCRRTSENLSLPIRYRNGLLFTEDLLPPLTDSDKHGKMPAPTLHLYNPVTAPTALDPASSVHATCSTTCSCSAPSSSRPSVTPVDVPPVASPSCNVVPPPVGSSFCAPCAGASAMNAPGDFSALVVDAVLRSGSSTPSPSTSSNPKTTPVLPPHVPDPDPPPFDGLVHHLTRSQLRILWHNRLNHMNFRRASRLHHFVKGVPDLPIGTDVDKCPTCLLAKARKAARQQDSTRRAKQCYQGVSLDFGFISQKSKDSERSDRLAGYNGETCYVLIADHYSRTLHGRTFRSKKPPLDYLNSWLAIYSPDCADKYVRFDLGGDLGGCRAVVDLFEQFGYAVEPIGVDASSQNGVVERHHESIAEGIRSSLRGARLPPSYWPFAFHDYLRRHNLTPKGSQTGDDETPSPFEMCTGHKPDLRSLRTFGCRVYVRPPGERPDKSVDNTNTGLFLGFTKTFANILYMDLETGEPKTGTHATFDEAELELPYEQRSPNAQALANAHPDRPVIPHEDLALTDVMSRFMISGSPFLTTTLVQVPYDPTIADNPLGVDFAFCERLHRPFARRFHRKGVTISHRQLRRLYTGSYLVALNGTRITNMLDLATVLAALAEQPDPAPSVELELAPERMADFDKRADPLFLRVNDVRRVQQILNPCTCEDPFLAIPPPNMVHDGKFTLACDWESSLVHRLETEGMTAEERALKSFTRRNLQKLSNWPAWRDSFDDQLNKNLVAGTMGHPVPRPRTDSRGGRPNICHLQWSNTVKVDGRRKCRACLNGSKQRAPWLRQYANTYASSVDQSCMRLFFALGAQENSDIRYADTTNAFQQSPGPTEPCFVEVDDAYADWYQRRFGKTLNRRDVVVPLYKAIQGHPEAGRLWETMINGILTDLGFTSTQHERSLYSATIDGARVLVCRQVDDFAIGSTSSAAVDKVITTINSHVSTDDKGFGTLVPNAGSVFQYNGVDVIQSRNFIKISVETYITRLLATHGWSSPNSNETDRFDTVPLSPSIVPRLYEITGPTEGSVDATRLTKEMGFSYRQLLGELIYAYVVCRCDIGYAITLLARFSVAPAKEHFVALKGVAKYLRSTKSWGIHYWRSTPNLKFAVDPFEPLSPDPTLPSMPSLPSNELVGFLDASHATELRTRRSVTGYAFLFAGGTVAYKSRVQACVSTSSTESEFIAAVTAAKTAKFLRCVLTALGFAPSAATPMYCDNEAAIAMVNHKKPTARSRHIDIQYFAIQEWKDRSIVVLHHIPGVVNPADAATKALGWTLHSRHVRRIMGHYGRSS